MMASMAYQNNGQVPYPSISPAQYGLVGTQTPQQPYDGANGAYYPPPTNGKPDPHVVAAPQPAGPRRQLRGKWTLVCGSFCIAAIPLLVLNLVLIGLVVKYREPDSAETLKSEKAIFVDISATAFTAIASWCSTVAPFLTGFLLILSSFSASSKMAEAVRTGQGAALPTPFQLILMIEMRTAGTLRPMTRLLSYWLGHKKKRAPFTPPMRSITTTFIMAFIFAWLVFAADSWLHFVTKSVTIFRYTPSPGTNLGFTLRPNCALPNNNNSFAAQNEANGDGQACNLNNAATISEFLPTVTIRPFDIAYNVSELAAARRHTLDGRTYQYLSPADTADNLRQDFTASTLAISTECTPQNVQSCIDEELTSGAGTFFDCNDFQGTFERGYQSKYFVTEDLSDDNVFTTGFQNPAHFLAAASILRDWTSASGEDDDGLFLTENRDYAVMLKCSSTVYDVKYTRKNGTIVDFDPKPSNISTTNAVVDPMAVIDGVTPVLQGAFSIVGSNARDSAEIADRWAVEYDRMAVAMGATAFQGATAEDAEFRHEKLVSRIPIAPLAALLVANILYTIAGFILLVAALKAARQEETYEIVERTSVLGLVAERFEGEKARAGVQRPDEMFGELKDGVTQRISVIKALAGGYEYRSF